MPDKEAETVQKLMLKDINETIRDDKKKFSRLRGCADGSFARATAQKLGAKSFICETTYREDPTEKDKKKRQFLSTRVRQHRIAVHRLLTHLAIFDCPVETMLPARKAGDPIRLAIYNGPGTSNKPFFGLEDSFSKSKNIVLRPVGPSGIHNGVLDNFDVVLFPGGSGSKQAEGIGETGREKIRQFVKSGGGYIGICGGAYLSAYNYKWSLKIIGVEVIDRKHWNRGTGMIKMEVTPEGLGMLGGRRMMDIYYAQGPLMTRAKDCDLPEFTVLAYYRTAIAKKGAVPEVMLNTPAIVTAIYGRGRVITISPHPEKSASEKGAEKMVVRAVEACAKTRADSLTKLKKAS